MSRNLEIGTAWEVLGDMGRPGTVWKLGCTAVASQCIGSDIIEQTTVSPSNISKTNHIVKGNDSETFSNVLRLQNLDLMDLLWEMKFIKQISGRI